MCRRSVSSDVHVREITYRSTCVDDLREFYADLLELPLVADRDGAFTARFGRTDVTFEAAPRGTDPFYHYAVRIPAGQLEPARDWLADRVDLLETDAGDVLVEFDRTNSESAYCFDPDGNLVEFTVRRDLDDAADGAFGPDRIREVNEVGFPVSDVASAVERLTADTHLDPVVDPSEPIVPTGDIYGMFVVLETGVEWFMTDKPAAAHPLSVVVDGPERATVEFPDLPYTVAVRPK